MMRIIAAVGLLALAGCSVEDAIRATFPDRQLIDFPTSDGLSIVSYACEPGENDTATLARATQAHVFVERNIEAAAEIFANQIIGRAEAGDNSFGASFGAANGLSANAELITEEAESRYQCLLFDERAA